MSLTPGLEVEIVTIKTSGDQGIRDRLGAFVREIQEQVLAGGVDVALHCLKDLPTEPIPGLSFAAYMEREDARDTLISRGASLAELSMRAIVGTGSVRRTSQLAAARRDLSFRPLVGNVDTRLRKLMEGEYDAIVLAIAGLKRLGLAIGADGQLAAYPGLTVRPLPYSSMLPAPGQAVLVLETRSGEEGLASALDHLPTRQCSLAERAFLRRFGGGCSVPVAAFASIESDELTLTGLVASPDGRQVLTASRVGSPLSSVELGISLAEELGERGAFEIVQAALEEKA